MAVLDGMAERHAARIIYVVDPSKDRTEDILTGLAATDTRVEVLVMSRRFGHQRLWSPASITRRGMLSSCSTATCNTPRVDPQLVAHWEAGAEVVQTLRQDGEETGWFKRSTSRLFLQDVYESRRVELQSGAADFRLLSRHVAQIFRREMREHNQFLRGLVSWVGFRTVYVAFTPMQREQGQSKVPPCHLVNFALNGICSSRNCPSLLHRRRFVLASISILGGILQVLFYVLSNISVPGWATLVAIVSFASGIQLFFLGVMESILV